MWKIFFDKLWIGFLCVFFLLLLLPLLLLRILATPYAYFRFKRSRYQQDFPQKFRLLSTPHMDDKPYTAIQELHLPIEYIKWREEYDLDGYFVYKDVLLNFSEPFFFDKEKGLWLWWPQQEEDDDEDDDDFENTDDCLAVEALSEFLLDEFQKNIIGRKCNRIVFFYDRKNVNAFYEPGGLEAMERLDDFVLYEKGELARAIAEFLDSI